MNLILITIDCLRADHLSCLDYGKRTTPNLDSVASSGLLFSQAISVGSGTTPSFIAIFTSTYPLMYGGELYVTNRRTAVAQVLKEHGYHTAAFHSNPWLSSYYGYDKGFDTFDDSIEKSHYKGLTSKAIQLADSTIGRKSKLYKVLAPAYGAIMFVSAHVKAETLNKKAISWLHHNSNNFFLWIHYMDVHQPYLPRQRIISPFERHRLWRLNQKAFGEQRSLSPEELNEFIDLYDAEVSYVDEMIGSLLHILKRRSILDNTVVIITADHGDQFMEHGHYAHGLDLYDELIHVPLIISGRGVESQEISQQVSLLDLAPTILDILNIKKPRAFLGNSLLSLMNGKAKSGNLEAISETHYRLTVRDMKKPRLDTNQRKISLRTGKWKYIYIEGKQDELYCLEDDPKETQNIIDVEPEISKELRAKIIAHIEFEDKSILGEEERIKARIKQLKGSRRI